jgi:hypothetical protein
VGNAHNKCIPLTHIGAHQALALQLPQGSRHGQLLRLPTAVRATWIGASSATFGKHRVSGETQLP